MNGKIVSTKNGKVKGKVIDLKHEDAKLVNVYRNIPFAKPPVGKLRFAPPQPAESWEDVRDGTVVGNMPMYPNLFDEIMEKYLPLPEPDDSKPVTDEDCLHLTVYVPEHEKGTKLPVMVYIYGGAFNMGSERYVDGSILAGFNDVIVVVPNYRVGIFGFLSLGKSSSCTGNFGLMDQQLSLKWVKDNIEFFDGEKNNVTIFGESAGSMSVEHHMMSPLSRGLFNRGIGHSCQSTMPDFFHYENSLKKMNKRMFDQLKIEETDNEKILDKLREMSAEDLITAHAELFKTAWCFFLPTVDGKVLLDYPKNMLEKKEFAKVPYIIGYNSTEGYGLSVEHFGPEFETGISEERAQSESPMVISKKAFEECKKFYIGKSTEKTRFSKMIGKIYGDAVLVTPGIQCASVYSEAGSDVYGYIGNFQLRMHHDKEYGPEVGEKSELCICDHGDDLYITFGTPFSTLKMPRGAKFTEEEKIISRTFMTYLTNFAKTGDPNKGKPVKQQWPKYKRGGEQLVVDHPCSLVKNSSAKEVKFWSETMSSYLNDGSYS